MFVPIKQLKSLTQENAERTAKAVSKWAAVLKESRKFSPIMTKQARNVTAMMLENQDRWIRENAGPAAMNTSVFGPANGLTGGALQTADTYAPGDFRLPKLLIPMVRRIYPALMSNETVGVQPMPGPVAMGFALRYKYLKGPQNEGDTMTRHTHNATTGLPEGIKGVYTQYSIVLNDGTKPTDASLALVKGQSYPTVVSVVRECVQLANGNVLPICHEYFLSIQGAAAVASGVQATIKADATKAYATEAAAKAAIAGAIKTASTGSGATLALTGSAVGISIPDNNTNIHITPQNNEMGYQRLDTRFTGRSEARLREPLAGGKWRFRWEDTGIAATVQQFENTGAVARTSFGFEKKSVEAGTRRIGTSWTIETQEDLKNTNGIDIESEAAQQMSYELQAEIDREMTVRMIYAAFKAGEWSVWDGRMADARWHAERNRAFYTNLLKVANRMATRNRRGAANFIVCTPDVATILETLADFTPMPAQTTVSTANIASTKIGTVGGNRFTVFVDNRTPVMDGFDYGADYDEMFDGTTGPAVENAPDFALPNYCLLGFKGTENWDAGIIYCPYIPIMIQKATDPVTMSPIIGLLTRYGVLDNIFGAGLYYHVIIVDSFAQPGISDDLAKLVPAGYIPASVANDSNVSISNSVPVNVTNASSFPTA